MLYGKSVVLGVTGGIAAYKSCEIVSRLVKLGVNVDVIMTENAQKFVTPLTFETLSKNAVVTDTFMRTETYDVHHISLAKKADVLLVAPATADVIGKFAQGIADDMLSTTFMASKAIKVVCPAMNTNMYDSDAFQKNLEILKDRGVVVVDSAVGRLACGDVGKGKMAEPVDIVETVEKLLQPVQDYKGKTVLVTAGGTEENIDGVRVITNHSSGKMGCAIACAAANRGAKVIFVHGRISVPVPAEVAIDVPVISTDDMMNAVKAHFDETDVFVMSAAPADYKVKNTFSSKVKSETLTLELVKNPDIAAWIGERKGNKKLVIFSAETDNLIENAKGKLVRKNADLVVANDVTVEGAGFNVDTNVATVIDRSGNSFESGLVPKSELAEIILDKTASIK